MRDVDLSHDSLGYGWFTRSRRFGSWNAVGAKPMSCRWDACELCWFWLLVGCLWLLSVWLQEWLVWACGPWLQSDNLGAESCLDVIKSRCYSLQLNLLLSLSCYKLACHYFSYTCLVATISLLTLVVPLLRIRRWDGLQEMKISSRGLCCPGRLHVGMVCSNVARRESRPSLLVKTISRVIKVI
jgi:hypothetical protein